MKSNPTAISREASSGPRRSASPVARRLGRGAAALAACAVAALVAGGCGGAKTVHLKETAADFQQEVLEADKPVLVHFFKEGCPASGLLEPAMDQLADEYRGRAVVAAFRAYTFYFGVPCDEIKSRYEVVLVPTVILFVNGQEKHRWFADYSADSYRKVLDEVLGPPAPKKPPAAGESPAAKS